MPLQRDRHPGRVSLAAIPRRFAATAATPLQMCGHSSRAGAVFAATTQQGLPDSRSAGHRRRTFMPLQRYKSACWDRPTIATDLTAATTLQGGEQAISKIPLRMVFSAVAAEWCAHDMFSRSARASPCPVRPVLSVVK